MKQSLGLFSLTMITIGLVVGMGIFRTASDVAMASGTPFIFFAAWILGGVIALCGALTFAEIGARNPVNGGYYKIFAECYHPSIAFALNAIIVIANAAALGGIALIGVDYLGATLRSWIIFNDAAKSWIAALSILIFFTINTRGLKLSANTLNALMILKIGMLIMIIFSQFFFDHQQIPIPLSDLNGYQRNDLQSLGLALVAVCFTYGGYQHTINFGGDAKEAKSKIPKSIVLGMLIVVILYLGANYSYFKIIGFNELKTATSIASIVGEKVFGTIGLLTFSALLFIGAQSYLNVMLMTNPRIMQAMAEDHRKPHPTKEPLLRDQPKIWLYVFTFISLIILIWARTFDQIMGFVMVLDSAGMALGAATLFYFRKKNSENIGFKLWWFPLTTLVFILSYLFVAFSIAIDNPFLSLTGLFIFCGFVLLYFALIKYFNRKNTI
ncbi:MAG: APC family permease [Saprospiraceae bacterium]|nr:APC family permease [Saprospiraceae bacterium]